MKYTHCSCIPSVVSLLILSLIKGRCHRQLLYVLPGSEHISTSSAHPRKILGPISSCHLRFAIRHRFTVCSCIARDSRQETPRDAGRRRTVWYEVIISPALFYKHIKILYNIEFAYWIILKISEWKKGLNRIECQLTVNKQRTYCF